MTFEEILDQAIAMFQRRGRLTYSTLKRQFQLDDAALEDWRRSMAGSARGLIPLTCRRRRCCWRRWRNASPADTPLLPTMLGAYS